MTINQKIKFRKKKKIKYKKLRALQNCCQKKGICILLTTKKPKRPNSANRNVAQVQLSTGYKIFARIPGEGHKLQPHTYVLVEGGRAPDIPGVKFSLVRGNRDLQGVENRKSSPSKYGVKKNNR